MDPTPCSQQSLDAGEPLYGSAAADIDHWLLLEHDGQWDKDAVASESLPEAVRAHARAWLEAAPRRRFQLVRDGRQTPLEWPRRLFLVDARPGHARTLEVALTGWEALVALDLASLTETLRSASEPPDGVVVRAAPLVLVCTHGRRDVCCARLGVPVFRELERDLARDNPGRVFQTTHLGGHRFAATMVLLPHGYTYGRLDVAAARRVVRGYFAGRLTDLDRLRGRSCYPADVQAAEFWVRHNAGRYGLESLQLRRRDAEKGQTDVTFWDAETDALHELSVVVDKTHDLASSSCGDVPKPVSRHRIDSYRQVHGATRDFDRDDF
jgi:hypothetical protein